MKNDPSSFFNNEEKERVVGAIREAEDKTSGEMRVHIDKHPVKDPLRHAKRIFEKIGMTKTISRNGVLIYINPANHSLAILGDRGIDEKVDDRFWENLSRSMTTLFSDGRYLEGVIGAIKSIGEELKTKFPRQREDVNELRDDISYK